MLQNASGIEVVHKVRIGIILKVGNSIKRSLVIGKYLLISISVSREALPNLHSNDLCLGVLFVDVVDELDVGSSIVCIGDNASSIALVAVICAQVDDHKIGFLVLTKLPGK